jgi:cysteinyl-tRNA synthetase
VLSSYYRSPLTYTDEALESARKGVERLVAAGGEVDGSEFAFQVVGTDPSAWQVAPGTGEWVERFVAAMDDDFNTATAIAVLFDLTREINRVRSANGDASALQSALRELGSVLGLRIEAAGDDEAQLAAKPFVDLLLQIRSELRTAKQYQLSDRIRNGLAELGVVIEDSSQGSSWKLKR